MFTHKKSIKSHSPHLLGNLEEKKCQSLGIEKPRQYPLGFVWM